jgi:hypothetical protein
MAAAEEARADPAVNAMVTDLLVITTTKLSTAEDSQWRRHKVIIAAAVAAVSGGRARIRRICATAEDHRAWIRSGRLSIQSSHQLTLPLARALPRSNP